jgi:hypothetical protein
MDTQRHARLRVHQLARQKLGILKWRARQAAARGDWPRNHELCRQHDDLALEMLRRRRG